MRRNRIHRNRHFHDDQDQNGLVHTHVGNKIASGPLIDATTSVCTQCVAFDRLAFCQSSRGSKAHSRETSNAGQLNERQGEGAGELEWLGHDLGRRGREGEGVRDGS